MSVYLYQIQYDEKTKPIKGSGFTTFDVCDKPEFLKREMAHMIRFYNEIVSKGNDDDFYGLFSPKFYKKTGLTAVDIVEFVDDNVDVCLFNPHPILADIHNNVWQHGEEYHPGSIRLATQMFKAAGFNIDPSSQINSVENTVYCNYWVAKKSFFDAFIPFVQRIDTAIEEMPSSIGYEYFADVKYYIKACRYPFLFERLISSFLVSEFGKIYSTKAYICPKTRPKFIFGKSIKIPTNINKL